MKPKGIVVRRSISVLIDELKACSRSRNLAKGKQVHAEAVECGADSNLYLANTLLDMYAKCGSLADAREIFHQMPRRSVVSWNALMQGYVDNHEDDEALELFSRIGRCCSPDARSFAAALKACALKAAKESGREIEEGKFVKLESLARGMFFHFQAAASGCMDIYVGNVLVDLYSRCGSLADARRVFDQMQLHDVVSWNTLLLAYADNDENDLALKLFSSMRGQGCLPDSRTFIVGLKVCSSLAAVEDGKHVCGRKETVKLKSLERGMAIHSEALETGLEDVFLSSSLVEMYAQCGSLRDARMVFDKMRVHDVVSWTALIRAYVENCKAEVGVDLFVQMNKSEAIQPNATAFAAALKACSSLAAEEVGRDVDGKFVKLSALEKAMEIHSQAVEVKCLAEDVFMQSILVDVYGKCGSMVDARMIFDRMTERDAISWNSLLMNYADNRENLLVLDLLRHLKLELSPNALSYVAALKACTGLASAKQDVLETGTLVDMYSQCGRMEDARRAFDKAQRRDSVLWTALMLGYVINGEEKLCLDLFARMQQETSACKPTSATYVAALKACAGLAAKEEGKLLLKFVKEDDDEKPVKLQSLESCMKVHSRAGSEDDLSFASTLVDTYAKCGSLLDARRVFDRMPFHNVVSWTALLMGYSENGEEKLALELFKALEDLQPNAVTLVAVLKACTGLAAKEVGKEIDDNLIKLSSLETGMESHSHAAARYDDFHRDLLVCNTLIVMYSKCGSLVDSRKVFDGMQNHNLVSWTALLIGYADNGEGELALKLFRLMKLCFSDNPDSAAYVAALKACGTVAALEEARAFHAEIYRRGLEDDEVVGTSLVDVYGKCGNLEESQRLFDSGGGSLRQLITWNALMAGYTRQGNPKAVINVFSEMIKEGLVPDEVTFVCVLTAFSHSGMVEQGRRCFEGMKSRFGVSRRMEHYVCMVDMLSRANQLESALETVRHMHFQADAVTWTVLMSGCCRWNNLELGRLAFDSLVGIDAKDGAAYLLMANLCGSLGLWEDQSRVLAMARDAGASRKRRRRIDQAGNVLGVLAELAED